MGLSTLLVTTALYILPCSSFELQLERKLTQIHSNSHGKLCVTTAMPSCQGGAAAASRS